MALVKDLMTSWEDAYTVRRVFGDPIEKDGVTVIPVAAVSGGGGGGSGPESEGSGGGFGGMARPAGVFVVTADRVEWKPAIDITVLGIAGVLLGGLIAIVLGRALGRRR